jgi:hypothetical protein
LGKLEGIVARMSLVFHLIEQPHAIEVSADIVNRVVDIAKTLLIPSYRYVFDETSGSSSEKPQSPQVYLVWSSCHIRNSHRVVLYIRESKTESL